MGMILVTHDLGVVAGRTDEVAVMIDTRDALDVALVFTQRRHHSRTGVTAAGPVAAQWLADRGYRVDCLHGDMDQSARTAALEQFRRGEVKLLDMVYSFGVFANNGSGSKLDYYLDASVGYALGSCTAITNTYPKTVPTLVLAGRTDAVTPASAALKAATTSMLSGMTTFITARWLR